MSKTSSEPNPRNTLVDAVEVIKDPRNPQRLMFIDKQDRLEAENLQLRVMNLSLQEQSLVVELGSLQSERATLQAQLLEHRKKMAEKYEIDFKEYEIRSNDGAIVPRGSTLPGNIR